MTEQAQTQQPTITPSPYRTVDTAFALLSVLFAFFFLKYTMGVTAGVGLSILTALFLCATYLYAGVKKQTISVASVLWAAIIVIFSLTYTITANGFLRGWCVFFQLLAVCYWIFVTFGNRAGKRADDMLGFDLIKSLFVLPFGNMYHFFGTLTHSSKNNKSARGILYVFVGLLSAIIPTAIVYALLSSGDKAFSNLLDHLFSGTEDAIGNNIGLWFLAFPFGLLIFGLLYGASVKAFPESMTREGKEQLTQSLRFASPVITCAALTPMLGIYLLFFISQAPYYLSAFANLKPEGYSYAEYARDGFFNLCGVCFVNALVILVVHFLTKRTGKHGYAIPAKIFIILFSLSSIVLAVIALRKMAMYIDQYGLTLLRVYASWFMVLLSIFFLILIVKQFVHKLNGIFCALVAFLILFGGLCLCNVDARIAEYNINHYLSGDLEELDFYMLRNDLSDSAILVVDEAYDRFDEETKKRAYQIFFEPQAIELSENLTEQYYYEQYYSFRSWNSESAAALRILKARCPERFASDDLYTPYGWAW